MLVIVVIANQLFPKFPIRSMLNWTRITQDRFSIFSLRMTQRTCRMIIQALHLMTSALSCGKTDRGKKRCACGILGESDDKQVFLHLLQAENKRIG